MENPITSSKPTELLPAAFITSTNVPEASASTSNTSKTSLTDEQIKRIELSRLKAKALQREARARAAIAEGSTVNANNKRPLEVTAATSTSPTAPSKRAYDEKDQKDKDTRPLKKNSRLSNYYEYNLSKMVNSKGGFLVDEAGGPGKEVDEEIRTREKQRERERAAKNVEPFRHPDPTLNPKCRECNTMDIDHIYNSTFRCRVCNTCKNTYPEKYSLLTKTECKEDYLLTDAELRDEEELPHMLKQNPHSATWNNMMLFVRYQVEEFAWKKWGSPEELDKEFFRREEEKRRKKSKKFEKGLRELRRKTREGIWQKRKDEEHEHDFGAIQVDDDDEEALGKQRCKECGFEIEVEVF